MALVGLLNPVPEGVIDAQQLIARAVRSGAGVAILQIIVVCQIILAKYTHISAIHRGQNRFAHKLSKGLAVSLLMGLALGLEGAQALPQPQPHLQEAALGLAVSHTGRLLLAVPRTGLLL